VTDPGVGAATPAGAHVEELAAAVVARLARRQESLATAESLTGGMIGAALTSVPGASRVYRGGVISYATDLKAVLAGVDPDTLERLGAVAAETAAEMAAGVASRCGSDHGLAVTGVAGPDEQDGHPVGQVFVALAGPGSVVVEHLFRGDRAAIRDATVEAAMGLVLRRLAEPAGS
jgi:nicotinamide-nucleotide amidase